MASELPPVPVLAPFDDPRAFALRRSKHRVAVLRALAFLMVATASEIASQAHVPLGYVWAALVGRMPRYRVEHSLVELGLVRRLRTPLGPVFELTAEGEAVVRAIEESERLGLRAY